jgi:hypothetical protein
MIGKHPVFTFACSALHTNIQYVMYVQTIQTDFPQVQIGTWTLYMYSASTRHFLEGCCALVPFYFPGGALPFNFFVF